ncbi:MAG: hypothetical protein NC097_06090 [Clostridium sp.]|nr:hypothetical protein [Prevotella sp.]MCM1429349.1 hypothetical protein [Clostridium sp.]MCM1475617.1 hypothetical protein [Muribaculaceae bacterium]
MTLQEIQQRHSVRSFRELPLSAQHVRTLKADLTMINTHEAGLEYHLITDNSSAIAKFNKSYGFFRNARNYIAVVCDNNYSDVKERAGFFAEQIVLQATVMGIATCFVGGTFSRDNIDIPLRAGQEIPFIILMGYKDTIEPPRPLARFAMKLAHIKSMSPENFYVERKGWPLQKALKTFPYLMDGLKAVAAAPSSMNKRPVRLWIGTKDEQPVVRIGIPEIKPTQLIDLGIAKCNFAEVADGVWDWGNGAAFTL